MQVVGITRRVLALPLVNIGGIDILNGQHKLLLAILWQLMRYNIRGLLQVLKPFSSRAAHELLPQVVSLPLYACLPSAFCAPPRAATFRCLQ